MAMDFSGLFKSPEDIRGQRIDTLMAESMQRKQMPLLQQVAAGRGGMMAEGLAGMFGLKSPEEAQAEKDQKIMMDTDLGNADSLAQAVRKFKEAGNMKAVAVLQPRLDELVKAKAAADMERQGREAAAAYFEESNPDMAAAILAGGIKPADALKNTKPIVVGKSLLTPDGKRVLYSEPDKPKETYRVLTAAEKKEMGLNPSVDYKINTVTNEPKAMTTNVAKSYGTIPQGYQLKTSLDDAGNETVYYEPIPGSPQARELEQQRQKTVGREATAARTSNIVVSNIDKALDIIEGDNWATGKAGAFVDVAGKLTGGIASANTARKDLETATETIRANIGFDRLQRMREDSPTGGALGQVAVQELVALQATLGSLDLNQSPEKLKENLNVVKDQYLQAATTLANSYDDSVLAKYGLSQYSAYRTHDPVTGEALKGKGEPVVTEEEPAQEPLTINVTKGQVQLGPLLPDQSIAVGMEDGEYTNRLTGEKIYVYGGKAYGAGQ